MKIEEFVVFSVWNIEMLVPPENVTDEYDNDPESPFYNMYEEDSSPCRDENGEVCWYHRIDDFIYVVRNK